MHRVPDDLRHRPFARAEALASGLPRGVLAGPQFRRVHHGVYRHRDLELGFDDRVAAARLALPPGAVTTGLTRLQQLGIDRGPRAPLHFVLEGDHHLALDGVFLHRTVKMPPHDGDHATVEAAYVAYCADARALEAVTMGCELLRRRDLDVRLLEDLLAGERWRRGVPETAYVLPMLDDRYRSVPEAELLAYVVASGLPVPDVNRTVALTDGTVLSPDQWFETHGVAVEYEGSQHQEDRGQYNADIDRYAAYRRNGVSYVQVTKERMRSPRATVRAVHRALLAGGYEGQAPDFGVAWHALQRPLRELVRHRPVPRGE
ncbi:hypothetical protein [Nocardioides zeicaulis]|uniref:DUF559 domain-containing protein n=1 Tax=Nocardioides zeicaulis TaxID=1776857 RepID=A0ABV6E614_9ACTN